VERDLAAAVRRGYELIDETCAEGEKFSKQIK
jgi:hypothetical protein